MAWALFMGLGSCVPLYSPAAKPSFSKAFSSFYRRCQSLKKLKHSNCGGIASPTANFVNVVPNLVEENP